MHVLVLTVLAALLAACQGATFQVSSLNLAKLAPLGRRGSARFIEDEKIVGGRSTQISSNPFMVSLMKYFTFANKWFHNCGATILNEYNILSAAHCYLEEPKAKYAIRAGSTYRNKGGVVISVTKVFPHPKSDLERLDYDVAIFRLEKALTFSSTISPIQLPPMITPKEGTFFTIAGWGARMTYDFEYPTQLRQTMVATINHAKCTEEYKGFRNVTDRMICAAQSGKDSCTGDSGGPMYTTELSPRGKTYVQYGITSWGKECAEKNNPGVYCILTNAEIRDFIASALKKK